MHIYHFQMCFWKGSKFVPWFGPRVVGVRKNAASPGLIFFKKKTSISEILLHTVLKANISFFQREKKEIFVFRGVLV